jgi:hypothetical protein
MHYTEWYDFPYQPLRKIKVVWFYSGGGVETCKKLKASQTISLTREVSQSLSSDIIVSLVTQCGGRNE